MYVIFRIIHKKGDNPKCLWGEHLRAKDQMERELEFLLYTFWYHLHFYHVHEPLKNKSLKKKSDLWTVPNSTETSQRVQTKIKVIRLILRGLANFEKVGSVQ